MVGGKIRSYLTENGIKQNFVAERLGMPATTLSSMLLERTRIDVETYAKICAILNVPLEEFVKAREEVAG